MQGKGPLNGCTLQEVLDTKKAAKGLKKQSLFGRLCSCVGGSNDDDDLLAFTFIFTMFMYMIRYYIYIKKQIHDDD